MIQSGDECPACGSVHVQQVVYGYPSPEEFAKAERGQAILAGPQPFDGLPTQKCGCCNHWWRHDGLTVDECSPPETCHFCGASLSHFEKTTFETATNSYWAVRETKADFDPDATFAFHPLPSCGRCIAEIEQGQIDLREEQQRRKRLKRRLKTLFYYVFLLWFLFVLWMTCFGGWWE